jgi:hypothetical protein
VGLKSPDMNKNANKSKNQKWGFERIFFGNGQG